MLLVFAKTNCSFSKLIDCAIVLFTRQLCHCFCLHPLKAPKGRLACLTSYTCLEFQGCPLIPIPIFSLTLLPNPVLFLSFQVNTISILLFPKGRSGMSDILLLSGISRLSFFFLFPISSLVFFCLVLLLFLPCHFSANA